MALIYKQPIHTQLFKGHHIVLAVCRLELVQSGLQGLSGFLHLFDAEILTTLPFHFCNGVFDFINLLSQLPFLTLRRERNLFKLAVTDNNRIVVAGRNPGTELLSVFSIKVLSGSYKDLGAGIQLEELVSPLCGQVVGNNNQPLREPVAYFRHRGYEPQHCSDALSGEYPGSYRQM